MELRYHTPARWADGVLADFDAFLLDHAAAERKASAVALSFTVRYPDRVDILAPLIALAIEELQHFQAVVALVHERGLILTKDEKDPYLAGLMPHVQTTRDGRLLDRLLLGAVVEARGCERFGLVADALPAGDLKKFYREIVRSEEQHTGLFYQLAKRLFEEQRVDDRLSEWLDIEAAIVEALPFRAALH